MVDCIQLASKINELNEGFLAQCCTKAILNHSAVSYYTSYVQTLVATFVDCCQVQDQLCPLLFLAHDDCGPCGVKQWSTASKEHFSTQDSCGACAVY